MAKRSGLIKKEDARRDGPVARILTTLSSLVVELSAAVTPPWLPATVPDLARAELVDLAFATRARGWWAVP